MVNLQMKKIMKSMKTILACACAALAVSCAESNENVKPAVETRTVTLKATSATIESQDKTRTGLQFNRQDVTWLKGDLIQLWYRTKDGAYAKAGELSALAQGSTTSFTGECTFTDEAAEPHYIAISHYCAESPEEFKSVRYENGKFVFPNPAGYLLKPKFTTPADGYIGFAAPNPSIAQGTDLNSMHFKNIFGVMQMRVALPDSRWPYKIYFKPTGMAQGTVFTGEYHYDPASGEGELKRNPMEDTNLTIEYPGYVASMNDYYIPVAPGEYNYFTLEISDNSTTYYSKQATKPLKIKSGVITNLGYFTDYGSEE